MTHNDQVSDAETAAILKIARSCLDLPGDFVEMGCYRGDTSILLAELLREQEQKSRELKPPANPGNTPQPLKKQLWLYDSFEGLPEKSLEDQSPLGKDFKKGVLSVSKREVKSRFLRSGLPVPKIKKSWFKDLKPEDLPEKIAFAFLDGDLYESIKDSLNLVVPKMTKGGIIVIHDYQNPALPGVAKAADEFSSNIQSLKSLGLIHF